MGWCRRFASMVMEGASVKVKEQKVRWVAEVDICIMSKIFATPRASGELTTVGQENALVTALGELVASKLFAFEKFCGKLTEKHGDLQSWAFPDNVIFASVKQAFLTLKEESKTKRKSTVVEELQPKVATLNADGTVVSKHLMYHKPVPETKTIPWDVWLDKQRELDGIKQAQAFFRAGVLALQKAASDMPFALLQDQGTHLLQATRALSAGDLFIPLFYTKETSLRTLGDQTITRSVRAVDGSVSWPVTEMEKDLGIEGDSHDFHFFVQPELKLPKKNEQRGTVRVDFNRCGSSFLGNQAANM